MVLSGSVALGRALGGNFVPPKDSGLGRLQLVLIGCAVTLHALWLALRLSSCRVGASLDVAALFSHVLAGIVSDFMLLVAQVHGCELARIAEVTAFLNIPSSLGAPGY